MPEKSTFTRLAHFSLWLWLLLGANHSHAQQPVLNLDSLQSTLTLSELLNRAQELNRSTQAISVQLKDTTALNAFRSATAELELSVMEAKEESDLFLKSYSRNWLIKNLEVKWNQADLKSQKLNNQLTEAIQKNEKELTLTREQSKTWSTTRSELTSNTLGESLRQPIGELLISLREEERLLQQKIRTYLRLQQKVTTSHSIISNYQEIIKPFSEQDFISLLKRNETFIWERQSSIDSAHLVNMLHRTYRLSSSDIVEYLIVNTGKLILAIMISLFILWIVWKSKKAIHQNSSDEMKIITGGLAMGHMGAYSFTIIIILLLAILTNRPPLFSEALLLLFTYPLIALMIQKAKGVIQFVTIGFLLLYWSYKLFNFIIIDNRLTSYIDLFHSLVATIFLGILFRNKQEFRNQFPELYEVYKGSLIPVLLVLTCLAVILQVTGFSLLARALTNGAISYGYLAPVILISAVITRNIFKILEQTTTIKNSVLAQQYYSLIYSGIRLGALYVLFMTLIRVYSLEPTFVALVQEIWSFGGQFGEFTITLGGILEFFLIIVIALMVSGIVQILLEGEILSRFNLKRGVGMAIGVIAKYSIVVLGFLMAVASTGFDLTKISILAGAIGVGIGFGLQNLVANFMAGLILIFERPFVVNDTIESEQVEGTVQEIGIRASKILTYDGAEVIIPNSNLISNRVSNWTLTSSSRRQIIVVRTAMHADPEEVTKIVVQIVARQENVLVTPEPFVVFDGQVEQTLQFKLYYWLVSEMLKTRSDINLQIYRELKTMGVELPIPVHAIQSKQDIRIDKS